VSFERLKLVLVKLFILYSPPLPAITFPVILILVSLLVKAQVKGTLCGSLVLHLEAPSSIVPELFEEEKLTVLSFKQSETNPEISVSMLPSLFGSIPALLNFQEDCVRRVVLLLPLGESESFFLQEKNMPELRNRANDIYCNGFIFLNFTRELKFNIKAYQELARVGVGALIETEFRYSPAAIDLRVQS